MKKKKKKKKIYIYIYIYICCDQGKKQRDYTFILQACSVIAHSSGDFIIYIYEINSSTEESTPEEINVMSLAK